MNPRLRFLLIGSAFVLALTLFAKWAQAQANEGSALSRLTGEIGVLNNWIDKGVSQTNNSFAMQAALGYRMQNFNFGLWGSNVNFGGSENLNLRPYLGVDVPLSSTSGFWLRYSFSRYYQGSSRDGGILNLRVKAFDYNVTYEANSKFMGIAAMNTISLSKEWPLPANFFVEGSLSYHQIAEENYTSYFTIMGDFRYPVREFNVLAGIGYNTKGGQFQGGQSLPYYIGLRARF